MTLVLTRCFFFLSWSSSSMPLLSLFCFLHISFPLSVFLPPSRKHMASKHGRMLKYPVVEESERKNRSWQRGNRESVHG